jgi:hypothetical protein
VVKPLKEALHIEVFFLSSPSVSSFVAIIYCLPCNIRVCLQLVVFCLYKLEFIEIHIAT